MSLISIIRLVTLCLSLLFAIVVLGLSARWIQESVETLRITYKFEIAALIASLFTLLIVPILLIIAAVRKNAFTSMVIVELPILGALWLVWLVAASLTADASGVFYPFGCDNEFGARAVFCSYFMGIEALAFLNWLILMVYSIVLLTFTLIAQSRGNNVWRLSVSEAVFFPPNVASAASGQQEIMTSAPTIVASQYQYPPANIAVPMQQAPMSQNNPRPTPSYPQV